MPPACKSSLRRGTRGSCTQQQQTAQGYPQPYLQAVHRINAYARQANLRPLIYDLPFAASSTNVSGLRLRLARNRTFAVSETNPEPDAFPPELQAPMSPRISHQQNVDNVVDDVITRGPAGFMVLLVQPPPGVDFRDPLIHNGSSEQLAAGTLPLCGVIVRIGPREKAEDPDVEDLVERAIVSAFVRRSVPLAVSRELLQVCLLRAALEAICYEEASGVEGPERDRRFVTLATSDLFYCPSVLVACLRPVRFAVHWDTHSSDVAAFRHDEQCGKECACHRRYRKELDKLEVNETARSMQRKLGLYQFWMLTAKQLKTAIEHGAMASCVADVPSDDVLYYCCGGVEEDTAEERQQQGGGGGGGGGAATTPPPPPAGQAELHKRIRT